MLRSYEQSRFVSREKFVEKTKFSSKCLKSYVKSSWTSTIYWQTNSFQCIQKSKHPGICNKICGDKTKSVYWQTVSLAEFWQCLIPQKLKKLSGKHWRRKAKWWSLNFCFAETRKRYLSLRCEVLTFRKTTQLRQLLQIITWLTLTDLHLDQEEVNLLKVHKSPTK